MSVLFYFYNAYQGIITNNKSSDYLTKDEIVFNHFIQKKIYALTDIIVYIF